MIMLLIKMPWLSLLNLQFLYTNQNVSWMHMNYRLNIMFNVKYSLNGKIIPRKGATWENVSNLKKRLPSSIFEEKNFS